MNVLNHTGKVTTPLGGKDVPLVKDHTFKMFRNKILKIINFLFYNSLTFSPPQMFNKF